MCAVHLSLLPIISEVIAVAFFNQQQFPEILQQLSGAKQLANLPLHVFESIPSTNQKLWELIDEGADLPLAAIAVQQTAGRGQWGRQWHSKPGGLYLSVALTPSILAQDAPHLTLFSAWGIVAALRHCQIPVLIKWPNDLILEGCKLGGIKSETRLQQGQIQQAAIGVGINWSNPVPEMGINLQSFLKNRHTPYLTSLEILAAITVQGLFAGYHSYLWQGIEGILPSYLNLLHSRGLQVRVNDSPGVVVGVTAAGELRVKLYSLGATTEICLPPGSISLGYHTKELS